MYLVSSVIYEEVAKLLREDIGYDSYYSGVVELSFMDDSANEVECRVLASLIIYRSTRTQPEGCVEIISNIVPVWIECHTIINSEEKINDFDIEELKSYICL